MMELKAVLECLDYGRWKDFFQMEGNNGFFQRGKLWWNFILPTQN